MFSSPSVFRLITLVQTPRNLSRLKVIAVGKSNRPCRYTWSVFLLLLLKSLLEGRDISNLNTFCIANTYPVKKRYPRGNGIWQDDFDNKHTSKAAYAAVQQGITSGKIQVVSCIATCLVKWLMYMLASLYCQWTF